MINNKPTILLLTGGKYHDYDAAANTLEAALGARFEVVTTRQVEDLRGLAGGQFEVVIICALLETMSAEASAALRAFVEAGGGLVGIHAAAVEFDGAEDYLALLGARFVTHGPILDFTVHMTDPTHPVAARSSSFTITDELYVMQPTADSHTFAVAYWQGSDQPMGFERRVGAGRVLYLANGHDARALENPYFLRMVERAARVAAGETFDSTVKAGILGYGGAFDMGKRHGEMIREQHQMDVTAVCDLDPTRTAQARADFGQHIATYNDMNAFLKEGDFDLCIQILPHHLHADAVIKTLKTGRHVITEKPFCITLDEADAMLAAARENGRMLSCYHNRRWDGDFHTLLQLVRAGRIGEVYRIDAGSASYGEPRRWWRSHKGYSGGAMYDWGAHYCDWLLSIANKRIISVTGDYQKRKWFASTNEDYTFALIRFEDGTTATLEQGSLAAISRHGWRVLGTDGAISNGGPHQDLTLVTYAHGKRIESRISGDAVIPNGFYQNIGNHLLMGERLVVTPEQARRAIGVIWLAEQSAAQGGVPLPLPGEEHYQPDYMIPW